MSGLSTWPIYLKLQAQYAYAEGPATANPDTSTTNREAGEYAQRMAAVRAAGRSLLIGPGGTDEVLAFRGKVEGELHVLTAYEPEAQAIGQRIETVCVSVGDMHDMPFETGAFGFLHAANVLEHAFAPYIALTECRRVLRDGGCANFVLPSFEGEHGGHGPFHLHCLTRDVWIELLHKTGLEVADTWRQEGVVDPTAHYIHYRCIAVTPPHPHDKLRNEIISHKAGHR